VPPGVSARPGEPQGVRGPDRAVYRVDLAEHLRCVWSFWHYSSLKYLRFPFKLSKTGADISKHIVDAAHAVDITAPHHALFCVGNIDEQQLTAGRDGGAALGVPPGAAASAGRGRYRGSASPSPGCLCSPFHTLNPALGDLHRAIHSWYVDKSYGLPT
jgi:hypothetical protein